MKAPRRNFVVEYKTGRRQSKPQRGSIWGNFDLRAVAKAVEAENVLPQAGQQSDVPAPEPVARFEIETDLKSVSVDSHTSDDAPSDPLSLTGHSEKPAIVTGAGVGAVHPTSVQERPAEQLSIASEPPRKKMRNPRRRRQSTASESHQGSVELYGFERELAELEAENRGLRRLMIEKLRDENAKLITMLSRFRAI